MIAPAGGTDTNRAPLVSIVTPTYNSGRYLRDTLASVQQQTYPHIEHIVVDGGSTDETLEILEESGDRVRWISEADESMYDALNKGFNLATGQVFTYLNSDDMYMQSDVVGTVVSALTADDSIDFTFGHCGFTDADGRLLYTYKAPPFNRRATTSFNRIWFQQPTCFWRPRVHRPFDTAWTLCADSDFFIYLCDNHHGRNLNITVAKFRIREDCLSFRRIDRYIDECTRVFERKRDTRTSPYLRAFDLYARFVLNWRANLVRLRLKLQKVPYL